MDTPKKVANWIINDVVPFCKKNNIQFDQLPPMFVSQIVWLIDNEHTDRKEVRKILLPLCARLKINPIEACFLSPYFDFVEVDGKTMTKVKSEYSDLLSAEKLHATKYFLDTMWENFQKDWADKYETQTNQSKRAKE